jgi:putative spermidine/putrescine transport system ATP-binding protein/spermidine/putrescine transport system ATP-binding protein
MTTEGETARGERLVRLADVTKTYGSLTAVDDVSLDVRDGEFLTLLGPSGAGKTTLLHMIAGFVTPTTGEIYVRDDPVSDREPYERNVGMVFQDLALFPHMNVRDNIAFPLKMRRAFDGIDRRVNEALDLVRLPREYADSPVSELSGGQQQRVAIARAVVFEPTLLLLDEPLSSLDKKLREEMRDELSRIHDETDLTIVHVTHNQTEALTMSDRIAVVRDGGVEQVGPTQSLYADPASPFVAEFVGNTTLLDGEVGGTDATGGVATAAGLDVAFDGGGVGDGDDVTVGVRAERVHVAPDAADLSFDNAFTGTVEDVTFEGSRTNYTVAVDDVRFEVFAQNAERTSVFDEGASVGVGWPRENTFVWPR